MTNGTGTTTAPEQGTSRLSANVYDTAGGEAYIIEIPVPGLTSDEIVVEVDVDTITVRTEPRNSGDQDGRRYLQREHVTVPTSRVFEFPYELDTDNVQATLKEGMLRIRAPKAAAGRRRMIRIAQ
jgi:HSP20 family protein